MLSELKERVYAANMELPARALVTYTWGNVSGVDRDSNIMAIKPSGVSYEALRPEDIVLVELDTGKTVESRYKPSSDTKTHIWLYKVFPDIGGIVHTHSPNATAWAQAGQDIPCFGTTHADYFYGAVPCTRSLTKAEIDEDYEGNTGRVIEETLRLRGIEPAFVPAVICRNHGPFTWGKDAADAVYHAVVLEEVAKMARMTMQILPSAQPAPQELQDKHFLRKHGKNAYYGQ